MAIVLNASFTLGMELPTGSKQDALDTPLLSGLCSAASMCWCSPFSVTRAIIVVTLEPALEAAVATGHPHGCGYP